MAFSKINIDGINVAYKVTGSGDNTIVMLQGWGTTMDIYDSIAAYLNPNYKFVQFDLPGFGSSDTIEQAWTAQDYAKFVDKFLVAIGLSKASFICHSYGGRVISKLALLQNRNVDIDKIVLVDSAGIVPKKTLLQKIKIAKYKILKNIANKKLVYNLFPELIDYWKSRQGSADYRSASPVMRKTLVMAVNEDLTNLYKEIHNEVLIIWGKNDADTPVSDAYIMNNEFPNSKLEIIEGASHYSFLDKPAEFRDLIVAFFNKGNSDAC